MSGFLSVFSLVVAVSVYFFYLLTVVDLEWSQITVEMIASSQHPAVISEQILLVTRVLFSIIIWASIVYIVTDHVGLEITVQNADGSKRTHLFKGLDRLTMFTVWSWILQGFYFTFAAICSFAAINRADYPSLHSFSQQYLALSGWVFFEISFPVAYLVSAVVTFVLIPFVKKEGLPPKTFFLPMALLMHNANVLFMAWEFIFNELAFSYYHFIFMLFYGIAYVVFSWVWYAYRGIFYYFFLDYQRKYAVIWYIVLLGFITGLFFIGYYLSILQFKGHSLIANVVVAVLTFGSMKLTDT